MFTLYVMYELTHVGSVSLQIPVIFIVIGNGIVTDCLYSVLICLCAG